MDSIERFPLWFKIAALVALVGAGVVGVLVGIKVALVLVGCLLWLGLEIHITNEPPPD